MKKSIKIEYFAILREQRGLSSEEIESAAPDARSLYDELVQTHSFSVSADALKVVINEEFSEWTQPLNAGDTVVFIPPVAGG